MAASRIVLTGAVLSVFLLVASSARGDAYWGSTNTGAAVPIVTLAGQYTITTQATELASNEWQFTYKVHNNSDSVGSGTGLDGFQVALPPDAVMSNIEVPPSYQPGGGWYSMFGPSYGHLVYWGGGTQSTYPLGTDAVFSFIADNVTVGTETAFITSFWGTGAPLSGDTYFTGGDGVDKYSAYETLVTGPVEVPEPVTMGLLAAGMAALVARLRISKK